jgi:hypothetical protein
MGFRGDWLADVIGGNPKLGPYLFGLVISIPVTKECSQRVYEWIFHEAGLLHLCCDPI